MKNQADVSNLHPIVNSNQPPVTFIRPLSGWVPINFRELWEYRELLFFLIWRDIKLRYKQTVLGFAWAIIQPVMMMVVFTLFFGTLAKIPSNNIPYPLFTFAALLPWTLFSEGLSRSTASLISGSALVQKVYCPRLIMPLAGIVSPVVDFAISLVVLAALMLYYHYMPTIRLLMLPVFVLFALITSMAVGLWLSATNVRYRDVQFIVPYLIQLWLLASPIAYSSTFVPERFRAFLGINPMFGVIEGFRWAILGTNPPGPLMALSVGIVIVLLVSGVFYFRRMEKSFADVM
jgi:lipopolysaccharide transport system permease protein